MRRYPHRDVWLLKEDAGVDLSCLSTAVASK